VHPRFSTPHVALISYGAAGILIGLLGQAGANIRGAYDMLVAMGVITYFIPYLSIWGGRRMQSQPPPPASFRLPGGKRAIVALACIGFLSTACTIVLSLFCGGRRASHPYASQNRDHDACAASGRRCNLSLKPPRAAIRYRRLMKEGPPVSIYLKGPTHETIPRRAAGFV
jgi:hypothetical protein